MKLRMKFFLIYSLLAIVPLTAFSFFSFRRFEKATMDRIHEYSATLQDNAVTTLNTSLNQIEDTFALLSFNANEESGQSTIEIMKTFDDPDKSYDGYQILQADKYCKNTFQNLLLTHEEINGIYLLTPSGLVFNAPANQNSQITPNYDFLDNSWYEETVSLKGRPYISTTVQEDMFRDNSPSIYIAKSIWDIYSHRFLGVILLDCRDDLLNIDALNTMPDLTLISVENSDTGETLYTNIESISSSTELFNQDPQKSDLQMQPLRLTISFNYTPLWEAFNPSALLIVITASVLIAATGISIYFVTRNLILPIESLSWSMSRQTKAESDFISPYMNRRDEIGMLYREYASMLKTLNENIKKEYKDKLVLLDAQMKSLEARINSHFLFNTLESINSMAELNDNKDIATMSLALGNMFRYTIKTKSELVTLADELKHVDDYVSIQSIRFSNKFHLVQDIPEELLKEKVLKLILQPLVENALYHGLNYCTTGDRITIRAKKEENRLYLSVSDNGQGMTAETLEKIQSRLNEEPQFTELGHRSGQSIGLKNIHSRIELYYGKEYGLTVQSEQGSGTTISICISVLDSRPESV